MSLDVRPVLYGRAAPRALRQAIREAQSADALTPVTVVVDRGAVGLSVRRLLASDRLGPPPDGRPPGLLNVRFVTLARLVHDVGGASLDAAGRRPLTRAVLTAAVQRALDGAASRRFGGYPVHPSVVRALVASCRELRGLSDDARRRLQALSERSAGIVDVVEQVEASLGGWYDEADAAAESMRLLAEAEPVSQMIGPTVWYLPVSPPPWAPRFIAVLSHSVPVTVMVGLTGEEEADQSARQLCRDLGVDLGVRADVGVRADAGLMAEHRREAGRSTPRQEVVSAPSVDAEVLVAIRGLTDRLVAGVPLERMALVDGGGPLYRRQVREWLDLAGIPFHGAAVRTLASTVPGRTLLGLFEMADHGWRREDVVGWMSAAPVRDALGVVPATRWEALSRAAGITGGLDQWDTRLAEYGQEQRARAAERASVDGSETGASGGDTRRLAHIDRLRSFVAQLASRLSACPTTWDGWSTWCLETLENLLGPPAGHGSWPDAEVQAFDAVRDAVAGLRALDRLNGPAAAETADDTRCAGADTAGPVAGVMAMGSRGHVVDVSAFRAALTSELDMPAPDVFRTGRGVIVGPLHDLVGLDVEVAFVLGMVDGRFPTPSRDDPLLPDRVRSSAGPDVPLRMQQESDARRNYLAALAGVPERILSFARGDQRQGREQRPARWLLDALEEILADGRRLYARDLMTLAPFEGYRVIESYTAAVGGDGEPLSPDDADLRSLTRWRRDRGAVGDHPLAVEEPVLRRGLTLQEARRGSRFTRFDGLVAGVALPLPAGTVQSPTGLERYGACPRKYFLSGVLGLRERDQPEAVVRIDPAHRGTVIHRILERFVASTIERGAAQPRPVGSPHSAEDRNELDRIALEELAEAERRGWTGWPVLWEIDRASMLRDVRRFPDADDRLRAEYCSSPVVVEMAFGGAPPSPVVAVPIPERAPVQFRGKIDRVDHTESGGSLVIDYKTGAPYQLAEIKQDAAQGRRLQLPIYALAAAAAYPSSSGLPVRALYWYVSERGDYGRAEFELDDDARQRTFEVVASMSSAIGAGVFPAHPGERSNGDSTFSNCQICPFDDLCPRDRLAQWRRKQGDPAVQPFSRLAEP